MIKGLNNNKLEFCPQCGHNCERMRSQLERFLIMPNLTALQNEGYGLKGQRANSPGQRPGYRDNPENIAPQGQKQLTPHFAFALTGRNKYASSFTQGVALGWWLLPLRSVGMPQRERLIELNKIAIQQMKVLEGVEERRMLK